VRTLQTGRIAVELRRVARAAQVMNEVDTAIRERLGAQSLNDLIALKPRA
jgi:hypothetical protein